MRQEESNPSANRKVKRPPSATNSSSTATGTKKLHRAPQSVAAEQSKSPGWGNRNTAPEKKVSAQPTARKRASAQKPLDPVQARKKENAARVAQQMAARQKSAQQQQSAQQSAPKQQTAQRSQNAQKQQGAAKQQNVQKQQRAGAAKQKKKTAPIPAQQRASAKQAPRKQTKGNRAPQNHAPVYNQYQDYPEEQGAENTARNGRKKPEKKLTKETIKRRKRLRAIWGGLLVFVLVMVGIIYSVNLLFRVKTIEIQAPDGSVPADTGVYTEEVILAKLTIALEDHFFSFSTKEQEALLQEALPLLENIQVMRDYPNTVLVRVEPAVATYTMQIADGWIILSEQLHVMEVVSEQPNLLLFVGATPTSYSVGQSLIFLEELEAAWYESVSEEENIQALAVTEAQERSDAEIEALLVVIDALEEATLLQDVTVIDINGEDGISFFYQDRIAVIIGTTNNLSYKLSVAQYILQNENGDGCAATDTGILDVSYQGSDGTISTTFAQQAVTFPLTSETEESQEEVQTEEDLQEEPQEDDLAVVDDTE